MTATTSQYVGTLFDKQSAPERITVAFTMAHQALVKGYSASVILMVDAVHLALPQALAGIDIGAPFKPALEMQEAFLEKGGKVLVCQACMMHNNVPQDAIDPRFEVITADEVIALLMNAQGGLQLC